MKERNEKHAKILVLREKQIFFFAICGGMMVRDVQELYN